MTEIAEHRTGEELGGRARRDPARARGRGNVVELIVGRPAENEREVLDEGALDPAEGLVGDVWTARDGRDGSANPDIQLTADERARASTSSQGDRERWPLAGDQLYVDLDLGVGEPASGHAARVGTAVIEITAEPHTGCAKFQRPLR